MAEPKTSTDTKETSIRPRRVSRRAGASNSCGCRDGRVRDTWRSAAGSATWRPRTSPAHPRTGSGSVVAPGIRRRRGTPWGAGATSGARRPASASAASAAVLIRSSRPRCSLCFLVYRPPPTVSARPPAEHLFDRTSVRMINPTAAWTQLPSTATRPENSRPITRHTNKRANRHAFEQMFEESQDSVYGHLSRATLAGAFSPARPEERITDAQDAERFQQERGPRRGHRGPDRERAARRAGRRDRPDAAAAPRAGRHQGLGGQPGVPALDAGDRREGRTDQLVVGLAPVAGARAEGPAPPRPEPAARDRGPLPRRGRRRGAPQRTRLGAADDVRRDRGRRRAPGRGLRARRRADRGR